MASCNECIHYDVCVMHEKYNHCEMIVKEIGCSDFKDKSRCIELPCKVGDTVYIPTSNGIINEKVHRILYSQEAENYGKFIRNRFYTIVGNTEAQFDFSDIGKTVFLTRKEAEEKLKELKDD